MRSGDPRVLLCSGMLLGAACGDAGTASAGATETTGSTGAVTTGGASAGTSVGTGDASGVPTSTQATSSGGPLETSTTSTDPSTGAATTGDGTTGEPLPPGARPFRFINDCEFTVWVGTIGNPIAPEKPCAGDQDCTAEQTCNPGNELCTWTAPQGGGWELPAGQTQQVVLPPSWGGRFWPRTGCEGFNEQGVPACQTGDCGGHLGCPAGVGGTPPATLAEFTLIPTEAPIGLDFYDVSNVDGSNIPLRIDAAPDTFLVDPPDGTNVDYYCGSPGCTADCGPLQPCPWDLDEVCPPELQVIAAGELVGCRSAGQVCAVDPNNAVLDCAQYNDLYGCVEGGPNDVKGSCYTQGAAPTCCGCPSWSPDGECNNHFAKWELPSPPEQYAKVFKDACPSAYSFPYDDPTSTFTCRGLPDRNVGYDITFCPK